MTGRTLICSGMVAAVLLPGPLQAGDPDFSGTWILNEKRSSVRRFRGPTPGTIEIRQEGDRIQGLVLVTGEQPRKWRHVIGGQETKHRHGTEERRCVLKWEGDALLTNTLVSGPRGSYTLMDRWKLSRDGTVLYVRRQMVGRRGTSEAELVYERGSSIDLKAEDLIRAVR